MGAEGESQHQRFFAQTNEGDPRQVYALDARCSTPTIFFLKHGGATSDVRQLATAGTFECPVPDCPCPVFKMVRAGTKRDHFVHEFDPGDDHLRVTPSFYAARLVAERVIRRGYDAIIDARLASDVTCDVLIGGETGQWVAVFMTSRRLSAKQFADQARAAKRVDASARWVFCAPGPVASADGLDAHEVTWAAARQGCAIWLNPIEQAVMVTRWHEEVETGRDFRGTLDAWSMRELGLDDMGPVEDPSRLPEAGSVWAQRDRDGWDSAPRSSECNEALAALARRGHDGILLVTDQVGLAPGLAKALAPHAPVVWVEPETITRAALGNKMILLLGYGDFVERARLRMPSYAEDQIVAFNVFRPIGASTALFCITDGAVE